MKKYIFICFLLFTYQLYAQDSLSGLKQKNGGKILNRSGFIDKTLDKQTIKFLPYTDLSKLKMLNSSFVYYGESYQLQGMESGRSSNIVDGMQVSDISFFPVAAIDNYYTYTSGNPIEYGNSLTGIVEINTITPEEKPVYEVNMVSGVTAGKKFEINQNQLSFVFGSPFSLSKYKNSNKKSPSIILAGNLNFMKDPHPSYIGSTSIDENVYSSLCKTPLIKTGLPQGGTYKTAEFISSADFKTNALRKNSEQNSFNPYIKITYPFAKNIRLAVGSYMNIHWGNKDVYENALMNSDMNPEVKLNNFNNYISLEHEVIKGKEFILNYKVQLNYIFSNYKKQSTQYKDNFFDYGYVGKFTTYSTKSYEVAQDSITGQPIYVHNGFADTLVTFEQTDINPILSNYTQTFYNIYNNDPYGNYQNIDQILLGGGLVNGYFGDRGTSYGLFRNVGMPDNNFVKSEFNRFDPKLTVNISYKKNHYFTFGFEYDKTSTSSYNLKPVGLWSVLYQQINQHLQQLDLNNPHLVYDDYGVFKDTIWYDRLYSESGQALVDYNVRQKLGLATNGTEWIDVNSYDPSFFTLDMFSADELLNNGNSLVDYMGYDHTGGKNHTKNSLDFFSEKDSKGYYTRNIAPFEPTYLNGYVQYSYSLKRLNLTAGFRMDYYDANQPVLKDPYLLYAARTVSEVSNLGPHPASIGKDYIVYVNDIKYPTRINGYRNGNVWYNSQGTQIDDPNTIEGSSGIAPYLIDPNQANINATAFNDYKPAVNYLPLINIELLLSKSTQFFGSFQMITQNPTNNYFRPQQYFYINTASQQILNNPDLKPEKLSVAQIGVRQIANKSIQFELNYSYKSIKGLPVYYKMAGAYPVNYITQINAPDNFNNHILDFSVFCKNIGINGFNIGINYERLLNENSKFTSIILSKNVVNGFIQYSLNKIATINGTLVSRPLFSVSLVSHYRSQTYYMTNQTYYYQYGYQRDNTNEKVNLPDFYYFDAKIEKPFYLGKDKNVCASIFVMVQNIFNKKNVFYVYPTTGKPDDNGYLSNPEYQSQISQQTNEQAFRDQYSVYENKPAYYDIPRMLFYGFSVGF